MRKEIFFALAAISLLLVSACDVYKKQPAVQGGAAEVPDINTALVIPADMLIENEKEAEEKPETANVIIADENEEVSLTPKAEDPDNDKLTFTFTSPLDSNGKWRTTYGDSGEYTVTVTASDGFLTTSKDVLIIVRKKEEAPVFESFEPKEAAITVKENEAVDFEIAASDLNRDTLSYEWKLDGISVSDKNSYLYQTTYDDSGSHTVKARVTDGMFDTERIWAVTVDNVNRKPALEMANDIKARETDKVVIELKASDPDGDDISYNIGDERFSQDRGTFTWETDYEDAGEYTFTVSASDGADSASQELTVMVENVNRAPVIVDIVQN